MVGPLANSRSPVGFWLIGSDGDISELDPRHGAYVIGRGEGADIQILGGLGSRLQSRVSLISGTGWIISDLDSANGTWVDGVRIEGNTVLQDGSSLLCGGSDFTFRMLPKGIEPKGLAEKQSSSMDTIQLSEHPQSPPLSGIVHEGSVRQMIEFCVNAETVGCCQFDEQCAIWFKNGIPTACIWGETVGDEAYEEAIFSKKSEFNISTHPQRVETDLTIPLRDRLMKLKQASAKTNAAVVQRQQFGKIPSLKDWGLAVHYQPLEEVGGDFYHSSKGSDGNERLILGDVCGHGVQAALVASQVVAILATVEDRGLTLRELVEELNTRLMGSLLPGQFLTLWACDIDTSRGQVECLSAGHHPAWILRRHEPLAATNTSGAAIGIMPSSVLKASLRTERLQLSPGDLLFQASDALIEHPNSMGASPNNSDIERWLRQSEQEDGPAERCIKALLAGLHEWGGAIKDDLTIIALSPEGSQYDPSLESKPTQRDDILLSMQSILPPLEQSTSESEASDRDSHDSTTSYMKSMALHRHHIPKRILDEKGDFIIGDKLGSGGMGDVFNAKDPSLLREVAIKISADPSGRLDRRFILEPLVNAVLDHPSIVPVYAIGHDPDKGLFFSMRRLEGRTWETVFKDLSLTDHLQILETLCDAVGYAHDRGIIHRDIKPSNVFLGDHGEVQLADWGLAATYGKKGPLAKILPRPRSAGPNGTPAYMAPEMAHADNKNIGPQTDVYLLGACLIEILTGTAPHAQRSVGAAIRAAKDNLIKNIPDTPLGKIARQACATTRNDRFSTAKELKSAIQEYRRNEQAYVLTEEAEGLLKKSTDDMALFRASWTCEQALRICPEHEPAQELFSTIRRLHADSALSRGDIDLAKQLLDISDPEHIDLIGRMTILKDEKDREQREREHLQNLVKRTDSTWSVVRDGPFSPADSEHWRTSNCVTEWNDGSLKVGFQELGVIAYNKPLAGGFRIELRATYDDHSPLCDFAIFFAAEIPEGDILPNPESGYQVKIGAYGNSCDLLIKAGSRMWQRSQNSLRHGTRHHLVVERVFERIIVTLDGTVVCDINDPSPFQSREHCYLGLIGWNSGMRFETCRILAQSPPTLIDPLKLADHYLSLGKTHLAETVFSETLATTYNPDREVEARSGLDRCHQIETAAANKKAIEESIREALPNVNLAYDGEAMNIILPPNKPIDGGLGVLTDLPVKTFKATGAGISDISPLKEAPLQRLGMNDNPLNELPDFTLKELQMLVLSHNSIKDLSTLNGHPITHLELTGMSPDFSTIEEIAPTSCHLHDIIDNTALKWLNPNRLQNILLDSDVKGFEKVLVPSLISLSFVGYPFHNLDAILTSPAKDLKQLALSRCSFEDMQGIGSLDLSILHLIDVRITDPAGLSELTYLKSLVLHQVEGFEWKMLRFFPNLKKLRVADDNLPDFSMLPQDCRLVTTRNNPENGLAEEIEIPRPGTTTDPINILGYRKTE